MFDGWKTTGAVSSGIRVFTFLAKGSKGNLICKGSIFKKLMYSLKKKPLMSSGNDICAPINLFQRFGIGPSHLVPDISGMAKIVLVVIINLQKHLFQETSRELA